MILSSKKKVNDESRKIGILIPYNICMVQQWWRPLVLVRKNLVLVSRYNGFTSTVVTPCNCRRQYMSRKREMRLAKVKAKERRHSLRGIIRTPFSL